MVGRIYSNKCFLHGLFQYYILLYLLYWELSLVLVYYYKNGVMLIVETFIEFLD